MGFFDKFRKAAPEQKSSPVAELHMYHLPEAQWMRADFEAYVKEGYIESVIANRVISCIAENLSRIPIMLMSGEKEVVKHKLLDLLKRPNPHQSEEDFFQAIVTYYLIAGEAYVSKPKEQLDSNRPPAELWVLRPDKITTEVNKQGQLTGYTYKTGHGSQFFPVDILTGQGGIACLRRFDPLHPFKGLPYMASAACSIDIHNEISHWSKSTLQNSARPSGALVYSSENGGKLNDNQFQRLKAEIDTQYSGARNAQRPLLLEGGFQWVPMSLTPAELDFLKNRESMAREIALAFGFPPLLLGMPGDNTYANYAEARLALFEETILPLLDKILAMLNNWLVPLYGENLMLKYDEDQIPALQEKRFRLYELMKDVRFLTINEKRALMGYDERPDGEVYDDPKAEQPSTEQALKAAGYDAITIKAIMDEIR